MDTKEYRDKLELGLSEYMQMPVSERSAHAIKEMIECWGMLRCLESYSFTKDDAEHWNMNMQNADGTTGGHWTISETEAVGKDASIEPYIMNVVMNMLYSDFSSVIEKFGVGVPEFYFEMAKAFINDKDGGEDKVGKYYECIVKG